MTTVPKKILRFAPMGITIFFVLLHALPQRIILTSHIIPLLPLMAVYYWGMFRPSSIPYPFLFLLGIVQDILLGLPLGGSSLILMLFRLLVVSQQRVFGKETFFGLWFWFGVMSALAFAGYWCIVSYIASTLMPMKEGMIQWIITIACYPLVHGLFTRIYRLIPKDKPLAGAP